MAYNPNELFATGTGNTSYRVQPTWIQAKTLAAIGAAPTLPVLTPLAFNSSTGKWVVWTNGGANGTGTIVGFLWPDAVTADAANDSLINVLVKGVIHHDDIPVPSGESQGNLDTALKTGLLARGLIIQGLAGVN